MFENNANNIGNGLSNVKSPLFIVMALRRSYNQLTDCQKVLTRLIPME